MTFLQCCHTRPIVSRVQSLCAQAPRQPRGTSASSKLLKPRIAHRIHTSTPLRAEHSMTTESTTSIAGDVTQSSYSSVPFLDVSNLPSELLDVYSDAILALPSVTGTSSYAASIVFLTLLLRTSITLPLTYWQRQRIGRVQRLVIPAAKVWMAEAKYRLRAEFRRAGKGYDEYVSALQRQVNFAMWLEMNVYRA